MAKIKEYICDLADRLGKTFDEVTEEDMQRDFKIKETTSLEFYTRNLMSKFNMTQDEAINALKERFIFN